MARSYKQLDKVDTESLVSEFDNISHILNNRKDLLPIKQGKKNVIKIYRDTTCSMAQLRLNNAPLMEGNFWDFHPGCHGGLLRVIGVLAQSPWSSVDGLAYSIRKYICDISLSADVEIQKYNAKYNVAEGTWSRPVMSAAEQRN